MVQSKKDRKNKKKANETMKKEHNEKKDENMKNRKKAEKEGNAKKEVKEAKQAKEVKEVKNVKEAKEQKEVKKAKEAKGSKKSKETKEAKEAKEVKEIKEPKEMKQLKKNKEVNEINANIDCGSSLKNEETKSNEVTEKKEKTDENEYQKEDGKHDFDNIETSEESLNTDVNETKENNENTESNKTMQIAENSDKSEEEVNPSTSNASLDSSQSNTNNFESAAEPTGVTHPLQNTWTWWYLENDRTKSWEDMQNEILDFDTVEGFWSIQNNIKPPSEIKIGCDYSLFKKGIRPMWEDAANKQGGRWVVSLNRGNRNELDTLWQDVCLYMIGELCENSDDICGAVVNIRGKGSKISVWTANGNNSAAVLEIGQKLKTALHLGRQQVYYQLHRDSIVKQASSVKSIYQI